RRRLDDCHGARCSPRRPRDTGPGGGWMTTVQVRYIVHDVDAAIAFYTEQLGFTLEMRPAPPFAMLSRGDLRLVLSAPNSAGGGGQAMPDGTRPAPGGWNRFAIQVDDLAAKVEALRKAGAHFRNDIVSGVGGKQILVDDPSGNPVELFEPIIAEARLDPGTRSR
ncbi:MAG TPA: VOC family protein, partial [Gaiellaceae bacterium]|nr:VOC family protein [Gaiellaceae bacterium]